MLPGAALQPPVVLALPSAPPCVGVDLAGLPTNPTGVAVMQDGRLVRVQSTHTDDEIAAIVRECGRSSVVAINAPLGLPHGRCCLDDACRCRFDPGTRSRAVERQLARERVPTLATALIKVLARRGISLASCLRATGYCVIEAYPYATLRLLGLPTHGKRSRAGRAAIMAALSPLVPGLDHPDASEHELDAVVCALTADLWLRLRCREVGDPEEGQMMVPLQAAHRYGESAPPRPARVAEHGAPYDIGDVSTVGHAEGGY